MSYLAVSFFIFRLNRLDIRMECTLGLCFKDFALIATDQTNARSILVMKEGKAALYLSRLRPTLGFLRNIYLKITYKEEVKSKKYPTK